MRFSRALEYLGDISGRALAHTRLIGKRGPTRYRRSHFVDRRRCLALRNSELSGEHLQMFGPWRLAFTGNRRAVLPSWAL